MTAHKNENPGCLKAIINLFGGKKEPQQYAVPSESTPVASVETILEEPVEELPYRLRDDFLTPSEFSFYKILSTIVGTERVIQSKVRLGDIFFVARPNENARYFNKIIAKHLDFLVCDAVTMKPLLGVELDDTSHQRSNRIERDEFIDKVFQAANLPLLHVVNQRTYNTREIEALVSPFIDIVSQTEGTNFTSNISPSAQTVENIPSSPAPVPICPKCGILMVVRTVSQGEHKGNQFYGCSNYPRCRETRPYKANLL